jgi:hypothetical protein
MLGEKAAERRRVSCYIFYVTAEAVTHKDRDLEAHDEIGRSSWLPPIMRLKDNGPNYSEGREGTACRAPTGGTSTATTGDIRDGGR